MSGVRERAGAWRWLPALLALGVLVLELGWHAATARDLDAWRELARTGAPSERALALEVLASRPGEEALVRAGAEALLAGPAPGEPSLREVVFCTTLARHLPEETLEHALETLTDPAERARCAFLLRFQPTNDSEPSDTKWIDLDSFRTYWEGTPPGPGAGRPQEPPEEPDRGAEPPRPRRRGR